MKRRLFLASSGLAYIKEFIRCDPAQIKMLFIPTAGNLDDDVWWIDKDRDVLEKMGFIITELDIETAPKSELKALLSASDIVYVAGGNTFHLLKVVRESGFDTLLTEYVNNGGMYAGASAGALIAGLDISPVASIDEPEKVTGLVSTKGLAFIEIIPIPHYNMKDRASEIDTIREKFVSTFEIVLLTDDEAIVVEDNIWKVVPSKRSELELDWFKKFLP